MEADAGEPEGADELTHVFECAGDESAFARGNFGEVRSLVVGEVSLKGDVEAEHVDKESGVEDDFRGFGVGVDIEFRFGCGVAEFGTAAHDGDFAEFLREVFVFEKCQGDIGEGADGDDGEVVIPTRGFVERVPSFFLLVGSGGGLDGEVSESVLAVDVGCGLEFAHQGFLRAAVDGGRLAHKGDDVARVAIGVLVGRVACDGGDADDVESHAVREDDGAQIVNAGIAVDPDFSRIHARTSL